MARRSIQPYRAVYGSRRALSVVYPGLKGRRSPIGNCFLCFPLYRGPTEPIAHIRVGLPWHARLRSSELHFKNRQIARPRAEVPTHDAPWALGPDMY